MTQTYLASTDQTDLWGTSKRLS